MQAQPAVAPIIAVLMSLLALFILLLMVAAFGLLFTAWIRGFMSGAPISLLQLLGMRFRGVPQRLIVDAVVTLVHRGHSFNPKLSYLAESLYLAKRSLIQSPEHLADLVEKELKASSPA
jgi:uncharacterized protein YqfA (UPF0365 family)